MDELPDYTVARAESTFVKQRGSWFSMSWVPGAESHIETDAEFWKRHPDAMVVALPTHGPIDHEWAILSAHDVMTFQAAMARVKAAEAERR